MRLHNDMRPIRVKIWWLMTLIAGIALAIPWLKWHMKMLERSEQYTLWAKECVEWAGVFRRAQARSMQYARESAAGHGRALDESWQKESEEHGQRAEDFEFAAAYYARGATLPWLELKPYVLEWEDPASRTEVPAPEALVPPKVPELPADEPVFE